MEIKIYPKVVKSFSLQKIYVELEKPADDVTRRIMPMEKYGIPHKDFRIDENYRYAFESTVKESENLYSYEHEFSGEQKYSVYVLVDGEKIYKHLYAVNEDFARLRPFKGDTHLHSCRSDGEGTPFEVSVAYRRKGFDFIAITDHHRYAPSLEGRDAISALTNYFTVFPGEEVHNRDMGYFHIINFNGESSVNTLIETNDEYVNATLSEIKKNTQFPENVDKDNCAYRIFVANEIRRRGGLAVFAHPFWEDYGEYNAQTDDVVYLFKNGYFDALEVLAGCDNTGNGNNLQAALWGEMRADVIKIPVLGASDAHRTESEPTRFNKQFSIVLANSFEDIPKSIKSELSVAVERRSTGDFYCVGPFRLVKYVRFLMDEYYPGYEVLCEKHAAALEKSEEAELRLTEKDIDEYNSEFFAF